MAEIDTRIQVPTLLTQIQQAASSAQGLGQNVLGGMRLAESKRQFDEQQSSVIRQQAMEQARMVILAGRFGEMTKAIQAAGDDDAAVLDILQKMLTWLLIQPGVRLLVIYYKSKANESVLGTV